LGARTVEGSDTADRISDGCEVASRWMLPSGSTETPSGGAQSTVVQTRIWQRGTAVGTTSQRQGRVRNTFWHTGRGSAAGYRIRRMNCLRSLNTGATGVGSAGRHKDWRRTMLSRSARVALMRCAIFGPRADNAMPQRVPPGLWVNVSPAGRMWAFLLLTTIAWEIACPEEMLLSEEVDRWIARRPWITRGALLITALHLANLLPGWIDPYAHFARKARWRRVR
jgi:hypothetical protein